MNPADQRLSDLLDKWLTSLELHLKYSTLDDASYRKVQPWVKHDRPSRWILELAKQKTLQLKEQLAERVSIGDAKFSDALELMGFLTNLVGSQHIERFIPLAEPEREVDLKGASQRTVTMESPAPEATQRSALATQPRRALASAADATREMSRPSIGRTAESTAPAGTGRHSTAQRTEARKGTTRRESKATASSGATRARGEPRTSRERELKVIGDAVRLLGWGRKWHELPELISRMADRPAITEVRRILRERQELIEEQHSIDS